MDLGMAAQETGSSILALTGLLLTAEPPSPLSFAINSADMACGKSIRQHRQESACTQ